MSLVKLSVWVVMSRQKVTWRCHFDSTVNSERIINFILQYFIQELHENKLQRDYFQQDSATAHTACAIIEYLEQFFGLFLNKNCRSMFEPISVVSKSE